MSEQSIPENLIASIDAIGSQHERTFEINDMRKRTIGPASKAFAYDSTDEERIVGRQGLIELGLNPSIVDDINNRRAVDNPLSVSQSIDQLMMHWKGGDQL